MGSIEESLRAAGVSGAHSMRFLQHLSMFQEQLHRAFPSAGTERILDALQLMVELHVDQAPRPDGALYIEHPLAVASQVLEAMAQKDPDIVIAALLHDAVEDQAAKLVQKAIKSEDKTGRSEEQMALDVLEWSTSSARVRSIVSGLTNPDFALLLAKRGMEKGTGDRERAAYSAAKNELYAEHVRAAIRDPDVALIKIFDLAANALNIAAVPDEAKRTKYRNKYLPVIGIVLVQLNDTALNITQQKREEMLARFTRA